MKFYIQMGHGMQSLCKELCEAWDGASVILSPLNIPENKLCTFVQSLAKMNGRVLFDPQMYSPRKIHKNLQPYSYWPLSGITSIELGDYGSTLDALVRINEQIDTEAFLLPSNTANVINQRWHKIQEAVANQAAAKVNGRNLIHTIALTSDVLSDESQIESIIEYAGQWAVDGVYIVCEHPSGYLVDKPLWVSNLLTLVAGIKRKGKSVIVGYTSHQMLCLSLAKCDAIAAGNFLNVRWFKPDHFETNDDDEPSRRSTWYYCPQAFSEYKVAYLDVAMKIGLLSRMTPPPNMENDFSRMLFAGAMPSSTNYKERNSHLHYLNCLKLQCEMATLETYAETRDAHLALLNTASTLTSGLRNEKIKGQDRDFGEIVDVIEAAIAVYDKEFRFTVSQEWASM
jgi:hypothetical protein